jgi:hypothetical protein
MIMADNYDLLAAIHESSVNEIFREARENLDYVLEIDESGGAFRIFGNITFDVPRGTIEFVPGSADFVRLDEVDIRTDINLTLRITIPEIAIPELCVDIPCVGEVCTPRIVLIPSTNIFIPLDLPPITSEVSGDGMIIPELVNCSDHLDDCSDRTEKIWILKLQLNPLTADIDLIDIADTLGDLFESIAQGVLEELFGPVGDIIYTIIGEPIEWLIRTVLDIGDDISEFFFRLLSDTFELHSFFADILEDLAGKIVIEDFDNEFEILPEDEEEGLPPVTVEISKVEVDITEDKELTIGVTIEP